MPGATPTLYRARDVPRLAVCFSIACCYTANGRNKVASRSLSGQGPVQQGSLSRNGRGGMELCWPRKPAMEMWGGPALFVPLTDVTGISGRGAAETLALGSDRGSPGWK